MGKKGRGKGGKEYFDVRRRHWGRLIRAGKGKVTKTLFLEELVEPCVIYKI